MTRFRDMHATWKVPYLQHYGCFNCKKAWKSIEWIKWNSNSFGSETKHKQARNLYKTDYCPQCKDHAYKLGYDCRVPKKRDDKKWKRLEYLVKNDHIKFQPQCAEALKCVKHSTDFQDISYIVGACAQDFEKNTLGLTRKIRKIKRRAKVNYDDSNI